MMNGYGLYVWTAFTFSFVSCLYLYLKTRIEFKKQEKIYFIEFGMAETKKIQFNIQQGCFNFTNTKRYIDYE